MLIGEFARRAGVAPSTVRFYERSGVLKPPDRTSGGYRDYDEAALSRVRYLRRGQELGFTLVELVELGDLSDRVRSRQLTAGDVASVAHAKLSQIDSRIADLQRVRAATVELLDAQCLDPLAPCPIVSTLASVEPAFAKAR
ncbi:heavy metal-responsive transcriptional regulator [Frondihabitans cladoniiphilus]|uniref:MerR family transcriptional regulator n=1 Tax=Frondihabitans cladoniiphilus TaxID=715785 RepID=A0ABP8VQG8_9MICO